MKFYKVENLKLLNPPYKPTFADAVCVELIDGKKYYVFQDFEEFTKMITK